ncbi:MAG: hypothetical protein M3Z08_09990 [Chloroflexota bacterium]|nr:hypothetical protein [Chloroflexota bacterium]
MGYGELIDDPILIPESPTKEQRGWAAFCAGAAEYLASRYGLQCPTWAHDPAYCMPESWYTIPDASSAMRKHFQKTAPEAFRRRNVFCDDHVFSNAHPSSREPGNLEDLQRRRMKILEALPQVEREAYLTAQRAKMAGKPRIRIVSYPFVSPAPEGVRVSAKGYTMLLRKDRSLLDSEHAMMVSFSRCFHVEKHWNDVPYRKGLCSRWQRRKTNTSLPGAAAGCASSRLRPARSPRASLCPFSGQARHVS